MLVPALACAAAAAVTLTHLPGHAARPAHVPPAVPAKTLALSHALATAPDLPRFTGREPTLAHAALPFVADALENRTPYPPGRRDPFNWRSITPDATDMAAIAYARDVQGLVEHRAACIWLRYLLASEGPQREAATAVLSDVPHWPALRDGPGNWADVPARIAAGDAQALDRQVRDDCTPARGPVRTRGRAR
jgi:hypothetical protein